MLSFVIQLISFSIVIIFTTILFTVLFKNHNFISRLIFIYLILLQVISIYVGYDLDNVKILKLSLFQLAFLPSLVLVFAKSFKYFRKNAEETNGTVIKLIIYYSVYQIFIILPLTYFQNAISPTELFYQLMPRLYFLLIPFIYWYVLPAYKNISTPINLIAYSSILLLLLSFYNYLNGIYSVTNTGELRLVAGVSAMLYAFTLVTSFSIFSHRKNVPLLILVSLIGFVFVNHRSAYVMLGLLLLLSIFISVLNKKQVKVKFRRILISGLLVIIFLIPLSQVQFIKENFTGRIASSFDFSDPNAMDRFIRWGLSFSYFLENPINGSMLTNKYYADDEMLREIYAPHNFIFELLSTQGVVGFSMIMIILLKILFIAFKNKSDPISIQMFLVIVFYLLFSLFNVTILNNWNVLILMFSSAVVLYRNIIINELKI